MTYSPDSLLPLVVEASLALAGFAGVVDALARRRPDQIGPLHRLNLVNLLATSFASLFLSLAALAMLVGELPEAQVWRLVSGAGLLVTLYFTLRSVRTIAAEIGAARAVRSVTMLAINIPLLAVCGVQVLNIVSLAAFWPFFLLLVALFGIGCFSFARLLIDPAE